MKTKEINWSRVIFYVAGILVLCLYHMRYDFAYGDVTAVFGNILKRGSDFFPEDGNVFLAIVEFTSSRYQLWSSRNIIEIVLIIVGALPVIVWHVLDILIVVLTAYCLEHLVSIQNDNMKYLSIFSLLMMYRVITMRSAGWIATTINYSWVAAMGLYAFLIVQRIRKGEKVPKLSYVLALLAASFAMNHEQMCGMMILILGAVAVVDIWEKKFRMPLIPFYVLNFVELILILFCPGNMSRRRTETQVYLPIYETYSLPHKLYEGVRLLLRALFGFEGMIVLTTVLLLLLFYLAFQKGVPAWGKIMAIIPLAYVIGKIGKRVLVLLMPEGSLPEFLMFFNQNDQEGIRGAAAECLILLCIVAALYAVIGIKGRHFLWWSILGAAVATKLVLGFSMAFMLSGERTSIYLYFALVFVALSLLSEHEEKFSGIFGKKWFYLGLCSLNVLLFAWNYIYVCGDVII